MVGHCAGVLLFTSFETHLDDDRGRARRSAVLDGHDGHVVEAGEVLSYLRREAWQHVSGSVDPNPEPSSSRI